MTDRHPPVQDWATDFDHTDPAWTADPYPIWDDLRQRCPVAHTGRYGGAWLPVTYDLIREVAYDTEHFTSRSVVVSERRPGPDDLPAPIGISPPITSDPPFHKLARRMLLPAFGRRSAGITRAVPARAHLPRPANTKLQYAALTAAARHGGTEPNLLDEVAWWQTDDFWQYALFTAVAYIRAAASRAGVPVRQACHDLSERPGHPAP